MAQRPILVPLTDSPASFAALGLAGTLARLQKAPVVALHVIEVARSLPINAGMEAEARRGEHVLRRAEEIARRDAFELRTELLQARQSGQSIVDEARHRQAAAIVLGVAYRHSLSDADLGATASFVLKHAPCRVIVVREAAAD